MSNRASQSSIYPLTAPTVQVSTETSPTTPATAPNGGALSLTNSFKRVPNYIWCSLFTALGGFCLGFDTGSIGPVTVMPQFQRHFFKERPMGPTEQGLIVSSILAAAALASLVSGALANKISRTWTVALGGAVFAVGSAVACSAGALSQFFVGRCIAGAGAGLCIPAIVVYAIEIAPASSRGRMGSVYEVLISAGIATGYFVCYATTQIQSSLSWRFPLGIQVVVSTVLAAGCPFLPHSPLWLHHVGRHDEARATWNTLGVSAADAEKNEQIARREHGECIGLWGEIRAMWHEGVRSRTALGVFLHTMQNACGIDGILYYGPVLFAQAGLPSASASLLASGICGLFTFAGALGCQLFADTWGRRPTMIRGGAIISLSMIAIGLLYASGASDTTAGSWAVIVLIYTFVFTFTGTWGFCVRIICSEIQPTRTRAAVNSLGQCNNWVVNSVIALSTPIFLAKSASGPYFLFGSCTLLTTLVCIAFQPETRDASLGEADEAFAQSPWRSLVKKYVTATPTVRFRRRGNAQQQLEDDEFDLDVIRLPEVPFGGPWHYAHRLATPA